MKIITAIGNPKLNDELRKDDFYEIIGVDIQYQDGIFEILEENKNIDYLILNLDLIGGLDKEELIDKILEEKSNLKMIVILKKENEKIRKYLISRNISNILNDANVEEINCILKNKKEIKKEENKNIKKKEENKLIIVNNKPKRITKNIFDNLKIIKNKFKKKKSNLKVTTKIITVVGDRKAGKTIFTLLLAKLINKKILVVGFNNLEINIMVGQKNTKEEEILKISSNIDLMKCNINTLKRQDIKNMFKAYNYVIFDSSGILEENELKEILKITNFLLLIVEPNIIGINNTKNLISNSKYLREFNKNNIKIIINKNNLYALNEKIIKYIFDEFKIIGSINFNNKYSYLINNNLKFIDLKIKREYLKIIKEVENL